MISRNSTIDNVAVCFCRLYTDVLFILVDCIETFWQVV